MLNLALRVGGLVLTLDLGRVDDLALEEDDPEPGLLFHGEVEPLQSSHLVR